MRNATGPVRATRFLESLVLVTVLCISGASVAQQHPDEQSIRTAVTQWCGQSGFSYSQLSPDQVCQFNNRGRPIDQSTAYSSADDIDGAASVVSGPPPAFELSQLTPKHAVNGHPGWEYEWFAPDGQAGIGLIWRRGDRIAKVQAGVYGFDELPYGLIATLKQRVQGVAGEIDALIRPSQSVTACEPTIDRNADTDLTLDYLATLLKGAVEQPDPLVASDVVSPIVRRPASNKWEVMRKISDAADLGELVWDISAGLQRAANLGLVQISHAQAQRIKAFGHWVVWLKARHQAWKAYFVGQSAQDAALTWDISSGRVIRSDYGRALPQVVLTFDKAVLDAALTGPITVEVAPPNIRAIVAEDPYRVWDEELVLAYVKSVAELYFTGYDAVRWGGAIMTLIGGVQGLRHFYQGSNEGLLTALVAALSYSKYGPYVIATYTAFLEAKAVFWDDAEYHWEDHIANYAGLVNFGIAPFTRPANPGLPATGKPIDEGLRPWNAKLDGKTYRELTGRTRDRRAMSPDRDAEYVDIEYVVPGPYVGKKADAPAIEIKRFKGAKVVDSDDGPRYFDPITGEPLIPVGQTGYHLWSHLKERKLGLDTGLTSIERVFGRTRHEARLQGLIKEMYNPHADRHAINRKYLEFFNEQLSAPFVVRAYKKQPYKEGLPDEHVHQLEVWSECTQKHQIVKVTASLDGQAMNVLVVPPGAGFDTLKRAPIVPPQLNGTLWSSPTLSPFLSEIDWVPGG